MAKHEHCAYLDAENNTCICSTCKHDGPECCYIKHSHACEDLRCPDYEADDSDE